MNQKLIILTLLITLVSGSITSNATLAQDIDITSLPEPTGPYQIGQTEIHLVDEARPETYTDDPDDVRELLLTVFYPAEPAPDAQPARYFANEAVRHYLEVASGILDSVYTYSYLDAPLATAESSYPVLILDPGLYAPPPFHTVIAEELASYGYIIVGIWHPYSTFVTVFPDGRQVEAIPAGQTMQAVQTVWTDDTAFVLNQLETLNAGNSVLAESMDLSQIGIVGWSAGASTATYMLQQDDRLLAGAILEPPILAPSMVNELHQPVLFMLRGGARTTQGFRESIEQGYVLVLQGSTHETFSDLPFTGPAFGLPGSTIDLIDTYRAAEIINAYLVAFFDVHIKGEVAPLLDGPSVVYEEVMLEVLGQE